MVTKYNSYEQNLSNCTTEVSGHRWSHSSGKTGVKNFKSESVKKNDWIDGKIRMERVLCEKIEEKMGLREKILAGKLGWKILSWKMKKLGIGEIIFAGKLGRKDWMENRWKKWAPVKHSSRKIRVKILNRTVVEKNDGKIEGKIQSRKIDEKWTRVKKF